MAEHKSQSSFPYIAIVALVAVVAVVVLVLNYGSSDSSLVVDEEGNLVGEASRGFRASKISAVPVGSGSIIACPEDSTKECCKGTIDECRVICKARDDGCWRVICGVQGCKI